MTTMSAELSSLEKSGLLLDKDYIRADRFTSPYISNKKFWHGLGTFAVLPIATGLGAIYHALRATWASLRAIGNLLILHSSDAGEAFKDFGVHLTLSIGLAVLAPIHALTHAVEVLTRTVSSWFVGKEPQDDLSKLGFGAKFLAENAKRGDLLPSSNYLSKARFFSRYDNVFDFLFQAINPVVIGIDTGINSLYRALQAVNSALQCIVSLAICKPKHAKDHLVDFGVNLSLSASLLVMTPVNALVEAIALFTRLGSTWLAACTQGEERHVDKMQMGPTLQR